MANGTGNGAPPTPPPATLRAAIMAMNPKIALAFFLVIVAAAMVLLWMIKPPKVGDGGIDAGTIALIASMIMLFIKMAADAIGYQYNSSSGSDKKDDTQAAVAGALADKVPVMTAALANVAPAAPQPWWNRLTDGERAAITAAAPGDKKIEAIVAAPVTDKAPPDDLTYLVGKGLLTQERADAIKAT